ncbi:MAG TPA: Hsp70 family protein, partial [Polyangiaceae bacterium]
VHAKDTVTGKDQKIKIEASSGLSEQEIQNMEKEAATHEAEDKERREQIERRNKLDSLCYQIEKMIAEHKEKLPAGDVSTLEGLIKDGREAVEKQDDAKIAELTGKLEAEMQRVASTMYQAAGGPSGPGAGGPGAGGDGGPSADGGAASGKGKNDGGVIDAEFEETQ